MSRNRFEDPPRAFRDKKESVPVRRSGGGQPRRKRAVNVSIDTEILKVAKEMNINLSQALEHALDNLTAEERARRFYKANKASIDAHNAHIERHGTLTEAILGPDAFDDPAI